METIEGENHIDLDDELTGFYVTGGVQRTTANFRKEWNQYREARILRVDFPSGSINSCVNYVSPPEFCVTGLSPSIAFKSSSIFENRLYACTATEIIVYQLPDFQQLAHISLPCFNDIHHVQACEGAKLLVAVTGLDMALELDENGTVLREWDVLGQPLWQRFSRTMDYRKIATLKPHHSHPNYVFKIDNDIWVTRFMQKDAICLTDSGKRFAIDVERPHDGIYHDGRVYFTTVDGNIVVVDPIRQSVIAVHDLNEFSDARLSHAGIALGWCRGLVVLENELIVVGFSRLRPSKLRENWRWARHRFGMKEIAGDLPTRLALYDLRNGRLCWERNLEDNGLNAIFSIHPVCDSGS